MKELFKSFKLYCKIILSKKLLLKKLLIVGIAALVTYIPCIVVYLIMIKMPNSIVGSPNDFLYIEVVVNPGTGFGQLQNTGVFVDILQIFIAIIVLTVVLFLPDGKHIKAYTFLFAIFAFSGIFNIIDRNIDLTTNSGVVKIHAVLDYFKFGSFMG
jgi:lipoprotein signal peptidase